MSNAADPQTDREWMIKLSEQVEKLGDAIAGFAQQLEKFEEKKFMALEERVKILEDKESQRLGGWKLIIAISVLLSIAVAAIKVI